MEKDNEKQMTLICRICPVRLLFETESGRHFATARKEFLMGLKTIIDEELKKIDKVVEKVAEKKKGKARPRKVEIKEEP